MTDENRPAVDEPAFRSPKHALARAFRLSRDRWKAKAQQRKAQIKKLTVEVRDLRSSRDHWKQEALELRRQLALRDAPAQPPQGAQPQQDAPAAQEEDPSKKARPSRQR